MTTDKKHRPGWLDRITGRFRKPVSIAPGSWLQSDMHAHWLPGIDDGARDAEMSLALVRGLYELGYRRLIATPHIYPGFYPNTPETIGEAFRQVAPQIRAQYPDLQIAYAAEYFMDEAFPALVEGRELLTLDGRQVLVEFSFFAEPPRAGETFFQMALKGYQPVLAHVERYPYYFRDLRALTRFREMGVSFQCNLLSLSGHYGPEVRAQALRLLELDWYDFMGTDLHHPGHMEELGRFSVSGKEARILQERSWNILSEHRD